MKGTLAALFLAWTSGVTPVAGQGAEEGWAVTRHPEQSACAASLTSEQGAALSLWAPPAGETEGFRLTLWLTADLRDMVPQPDGPMAFAFRPSGQPAVQLDGTLEPDGAFWRFTHAFADLAEAARFLGTTTSGRLTLFHPEAGVLASFETSGAEEALTGLLSCAPEAAE